jgi:hypothetical protein
MNMWARATFMLLVEPVALAQAPYASPPPHYWMMVESYVGRENSVEKEAAPTFRQRIVLGHKRWEPRPGDMRFESLAALEEFARTLPPETVLDWDPGCVRVSAGPTHPAPLDSANDQKRFQAFCKQRRIKFIVHLSG